MTIHKPLRFLILTMIGSLAALGAGCGKAPAAFSVITAQPDTNRPGCSAGTTAKNLRILVMVDNSGSTAGTDPSQYYRVQTLRSFLTTYGSHPNLQYSFGYFADNAYLYDMNLGHFARGSVANPLGNATEVSSALDTYHANIPPSGGTGYTAAFGALSSAITRDEGLGSADDYAVVFMSDGQPTDIAGDVISGIHSLVTNLNTVAIANGHSHVAVSAVYFGSANDATSIANLRAMATQGGGQFVDTNHLDAGRLSIEDVVTIPGC